ncbi:MAG: hypothetical protein Q7S65_05535, partial [Nanoarchaeota archaeon]|nr:hypothetical protein [Nanoarchaeota archaeon]
MSTRIVHLLGDNAFREIVRGKEIILCPHAVDRLSFDQRKIFKESDLIRPISQESPALVGIQQNGRISTYFRRKDDYLKII